MLYYALVSTAISDDRSKLRGGMRLLAEIAHKHGIPITWAIDATSARTFANDFTKWHEAYGDEPLLMLDITPIWETEADLGDARQAAEHIVTMREKLPDYISSEWNKVERRLPWAAPIVAGAEWKNHVLLYALEQVGFKGLWGYRSEVEEDRGCPFGFFFPSADRHNFAGHPASQVVAIPHASIDSLRTNLTSTSQGVSEDNAPENLRFLTLNNTAQQAFDHYVTNLPWNRWLGYVEQINAADVSTLTSERLEQLDAYFAHVCQQQETQIVPLSKAVSDYQTHCDQTLPTFLVYVDHETGTDEPPSTLIYYDAECQMRFEKDKMEPLEVKNYITPPVASRYGVELNLPQIETFRPSRTRNQLKMQFSLESSKGMTYGLAIWGDHTGLTLAKSNARSVTWVGDRLLFVRVDLTMGKNEIEVVLTI
ncbi:hypothetical protein IH992_21720 [Candidatus Poribacteria bacterium]|nr:hypothetical protein [Candidatus Poribacteria bacterium]